MKQYQDVMRLIMDTGVDREDRTGTGTRAIFGAQMRFNLQEGFPAVTTKKLAFKSVTSELLWFLEGSSSERRLAEIHHGKFGHDLDGKTTIWTANAEAPYWKEKAKGMGDLGRVYGVQWRKWRTPKFELDVTRVNSSNKVFNAHWEVEEIDQLANLIEGLKNSPMDRRHILTAWNPGELEKMALPPCHCFAQFFIAPMTLAERLGWVAQHGGDHTIADGSSISDVADLVTPILDRENVPSLKLSCQMYQRSCDMFLGVPFNIASYSLLTHMIAQVCNYDVGEFIHVLGDAHIYHDHFDVVTEQLSRTAGTLPTLVLNPDVLDINKFSMGDIRLDGYSPQGELKAKMAV